MDCRDSRQINRFLGLIDPFIVFDVVILLTPNSVFILLLMLLLVDRVLSKATFIICLDVEVAHNTIRALVTLQLEALMVLYHSRPIAQRYSATIANSVVLLFSCWSLSDCCRCFQLTEISGCFAHHLNLWLRRSVALLPVVSQVDEGANAACWSVVLLNHAILAIFLPHVGGQLVHGYVCVCLSHLLRIASVYHQNLLRRRVELPLICGIKCACARCQERKVVEIAVGILLTSQGWSSQHACRIYKLGAAWAIHIGYCAEALVLAK